MRKSIWLLSAGLFAISAPGFAQETQGSTSTAAEGPTESAAVDKPDAEDAAQEGDSIIVTATRRSEALSDVPLAVSAVSGDTMKNTGATDIRGLNQVSPSLFVFSTSSEGGAARANIRGIGTVGDNPGLESSVATFIDGVYRSRAGVGLTELGAVDRVEILRGPQGTLFGRNASAGLIHVITAKPRFTREIYGEASVGNYDYLRADAGVTGPITQTLAGRIDGVWMKRDGFLDDVVGGGDYNDRNRYMVRGQLLYQPNDDLSVRFIADYTHRNEQCCAAVYLPTEDKQATGPNSYLSMPSTIARIIRGLESNVDGRSGLVLDDPFDRKIALTPGRSYNSDVEDFGFSLEGNYDFGGAELTSITAYRSNDYERGQDPDFNNLDIWYRDGSGGSANKFKTFTQELRLQGEAFGGRLDWLVGGYYAHEKLTVTDNLTFGADASQYGNCLVANSFASSFINAGNNLGGSTGLALVTAGNGLIDTSNATCFNTANAAALFPFAGANQTALAAFARLGGFAGGGFTNSGFTNLAIATGGGALGFEGAGLNDEYDQTSNNFALFTHNIFEITKGLKLTLGLRYTTEKKELDARLLDNNPLCDFYTNGAGGALRGLASFPCAIPSVPGHDLSLSDSKREHKFSGTAVLSWKPIDEILAYASYSKGYKAGGFNLDRSALSRSRVVSSSTGASIAGAVCGPNTGACSGHVASANDLIFEPEINNAFELGLKYDGPGIDINLALFRQDFKAFQLNTFNGVNFEVENVNSCSQLDVPNGDTDVSTATGTCVGHKKAGVRSTGLEVEIFTRPFRNASFNVGMTYANTRYRDNLVGVDGEPLSPALFQLSGANVSGASELVTTASFGWTPPIGSSGMRGLFYIDARQMSSFNTGSDLDVEKIQKGFGVVNGRIGLSGRDDRWGVEIWAQNLLDTKFKQVAFDSPLQGGCTENGALNGYCGVLANYGIPTRSQQLYSAFLGEPRTFGITLKGRM